MGAGSDRADVIQFMLDVRGPISLRVGRVMHLEGCSERVLRVLSGLIPRTTGGRAARTDWTRVADGSSRRAVVRVSNWGTRPVPALPVRRPHRTHRRRSDTTWTGTILAVPTVHGLRTRSDLEDQLRLAERR